MARTKQTAKQRVKERKQFLASNGIFGIADEPGDNTPQKDSRTRYGNAFYQQCTEMKTETSATTDSPRLKEGDTRPLSSGIYLWDWKQDSSCEYKVRGGFLGCTEFAFFANAAIVTTASAGSSSDHLVQLHLQECDNSSDSSNNNNDKRQFCAVLYTKDDVNSWEYYESPDQDLHFTKIPQCINPTIDSHQAAHGEPQQHGGIHSDVWTVQRPDLIPAVKPKLNKLAATTQDRPIPRYQMIIDPNQCERKGKWVPSEFDVTPEAKVKLVGGDRAHWMDTNLIDSVATPVLQAALPLLSKLKRPKLLLEQQRLQVAVKAQRIFLPPSTDEKDSEYIGLWHIDGQHEPVAAVILFYYHVAKDLRGGNMEFLDRKPMMVKTSFASSGGINQFNSTNVREMLRGNDNSRHANCSVPIEEEGTLLVFSNYQMVHRVLKMINQSTTSEASRDFVALFVMDPAAAPLVPARCHLAQQYVTLMQRTLEGLCLSTRPCSC
ncbi:expressed unknown protein [Seminavis robusta]|uniref:DUF4246 domain-containing protein n=1 Tax=Seminavis robusta TaxID=568900 RepID=A0A9N8F1S5_9STRA|nr:expressed unknown protein [Seminavis robusta]|eukprot:Sro2658_g333880.1 n/a (491) ;mRNA; f:367-1839